MQTLQLRRLAGFMFIVGALAVNIPYTLLISNFKYPDILREPAADVLTQFDAGGTGLIAQWFAFAWIGIPLLVGVVLLERVLQPSVWLRLATIFGIISLVAQVIGLLRWTFVVPILADLYTNPTSSEATRDAAIVGFHVIHQFGGVLLGEHIGQLFIIAWMTIISAHMLRSVLFPMWLGVFGFVASFIYLLAQAELFHTVIEDGPVIEPAGLIGSLLWLVWMLIMGIYLILHAKATLPTA